jgi:hypothetical protein
MFVFGSIVVIIPQKGICFNGIIGYSGILILKQHRLLFLLIPRQNLKIKLFIKAEGFDTPLCAQIQLNYITFGTLLHFLPGRFI